MAGYASVDPPFAETYQNNRWNTHGALAGDNAGPRRSAPAELPFVVQRNGLWTQGGRTVRNAKPKLYLVRPVDGKRLGTSGRILDGLTGEGPDVFVSKCGDKRTLMRDRPQRWQWSGWHLTTAQRNDLRLFDKDYRRRDLLPVLNLSKTRPKHSKYDFRSRKYKSRREFPYDAWTDARWVEGARHNDMAPLSYRDRGGQWHTRVPADSGRWAGGRPRTP